MPERNTTFGFDRKMFRVLDIAGAGSLLLFVI